MTGEELTGVDDTMKEGRPTTVVVGPHVYEIVFSDEEINRIGNDSRVEFLMGHHSARQSKIYIRDTGLLMALKLDHDQPLNISANLGPLGVGIDDGILRFELGLGVANEDEFTLADMQQESAIDLLGHPGMANDGNFQIYLPIALQGALAGLQGDPTVISGKYAADTDHLDLSAFLDALGGTLVTANFDDFIKFQNISLDIVLDGLIAALGGLVGQSSEVQQLYSNAASGSFQLTFDGQTTDGLDVTTVTARDIRDAFEGLTGLANYPDGINVSVTGSGIEADPWVIQFITPDGQDIAQQIGAVAGADLVDANGDAAVFSATTLTDGGQIDKNSLAYRQIPLINKSLVQLFGTQSADVIVDMKNELIALRKGLDDIQSFEIDLNFAIANALNLTEAWSDEDKTTLKTAGRELHKVSHALDGTSSDGDLAFAITQQTQDLISLFVLLMMLHWRELLVEAQPAQHGQVVVEHTIPITLH